jgi:hypothetical protein
MHTATVRSVQSLEILDDRTSWRSRLRSILSISWYNWHKKNEVSKHNNLCRLDDRLLSDVGLYREHGVHNSQSRTNQQQGSPVPVALLAMWMPPV